MTGVLLIIATGILAAFGFALIAFSQKQHWRLVSASDAVRPAAALRLGGSLLIALAALPVVLHDGLAFGFLLWASMLTVSAFLVVLGLTRLRRREGRQRESE